MTVEIYQDTIVEQQSTIVDLLRNCHCEPPFWLSRAFYDRGSLDHWLRSPRRAKNALLAMTVSSGKKGAAARWRNSEISFEELNFGAFAHIPNLDPAHTLPGWMAQRTTVS